MANEINIKKSFVCSHCGQELGFETIFGAKEFQDLYENWWITINNKVEADTVPPIVKAIEEFTGDKCVEEKRGKVGEFPQPKPRGRFRQRKDETVKQFLKRMADMEMVYGKHL